MKEKKKRLKVYLDDNHSEFAPQEFLDKTAPLIGYIVHSFNDLDQILNETICNILDEDSDILGSIVIQKLTYSAKVDLLDRMLKEIKSSLLIDLPSPELVLKHLRKSGELRNAVIHAEWENMDFEGYTYVKLVSGKNGIEQKYIQFSPESLDNIDDFICDTYDLLDKLDEVLIDRL